MAIWRDQFRGKRILVHCDNASVVQIMAKCSSKSKSMMVLFCSLAMFGIQNNFDLHLQYIPGVKIGQLMPFWDSNHEQFQHLTPDADPTMMPLVSFAHQQTGPLGEGLPSGMITSPGFPSLWGCNPCSSPPVCTFMAITDTDCLFIYRSQNLLLPAMLLYPGRCLATHTALNFSTFQGSTEHTTFYMQSLWTCSTYVPPVLQLLWPPVCTHRSRDTLVPCYLLGQCYRAPAWHYHQLLIWGVCTPHWHRSARCTQRCFKAA